MKSKIFLLINIVFMALCTCVIVFGVYSITSRTIASTGKVTFTAHGIGVEVTGTIVGHTEGNTATGEPTTVAENLAPAVFENGIGTIDLGYRYFSNCTDTVKYAEDIVITLSITNISNHKITATTGNHTLPSGVSITQSAVLADLTPNETWNVTLTLSIIKFANISQTTNNLVLDMNFDYYYNPYYISSYAGKNWLTTKMGYATEYDVGAEEESIEWIAFAVKDEDLTTTKNAYSITVEDGSSAGTWYSLNGNVNWGNYDLESDLDGKTFWFISKYVIGAKVSGSSTPSAYFTITNDKYDKNTLHSYFQHQFYVDTDMYSNNLHVRINNRHVKEDFYTDEGFEKYFYNVDFSSKFWSPSYFEAGLLHGSKVPQNANTSLAEGEISVGEPLLTYPIGAKTVKAQWSSRSFAVSDENDSVLQDNLSRYHILFGEYGAGPLILLFGVSYGTIRPAFEITFS